MKFIPYFHFSSVGHSTEPDIEKFPDPIVHGNFAPKVLPSHESPTLISFDLETTDLSKFCIQK